MTCPHCLSTSISKRQHRTSLGYRTFSCRACRLRFNERTGSPFNDLQFPTDLVLLAVLWRLRYKLGFREVAELLLQRGFEVSHETIRNWEFRFAPMVSERLRAKRRGHAGRSWYLDETQTSTQPTRRPFAGSSVARCCTARTSTSTTVSSRIIGHSSNATTRCWVSADSIQPAVSALPSTSCAITCVSEIPEAKEFQHHAVARSSAADGQP